MPRDCLDLLSVRGEDYFDQKQKLLRVLAAIRSFCPPHARLRIRENEHEFGSYPSLVVEFDAAELRTQAAIEAVYALETLALRAADELELEY